MATVDTRSGFRLPWSSDRQHDDADRADSVEATLEAAPETTDQQDDAAASEWQGTDLEGRAGLPPTVPRPAEEPAMMQQVATPPPAPPVARKSTKLMVDLAAAIRATTETARDLALAAVEADATRVTEAIRVASTDGAEAIRRQSEGDVAAVKEWSKAEIARIREETEARVAARKTTLESELASHAAAVEYRVGEVEHTVVRFRADMDEYVLGLASEDDPARLATMAEDMPEPPVLDALADLANLDITAFTKVEAEAEVTEAEDAEIEVEAAQIEGSEAVIAVAGEAEAVEPEIVAVAGEAGAGEPESVAVAGEAEVQAVEPEIVAVAGEAEVQAVEPEIVAVAGEAEAVEREIVAVAGEAEAVEPEIVAVAGEAEVQAVQAVEPEIVAVAGEADSVETEAIAEVRSPIAWAMADDAWGSAGTRAATARAGSDDARHWAAAESAAEFTDHHGGAPDLSGPAAGLLTARHGSDEEIGGGESAGPDDGGFEVQSFADRLASLMPGYRDDAADGEPQMTQVIVSGLVSVASIASFKRHLSRLPGVQAVGVASGPEGEFVFHVSHRPDVSFRDAIPSMPGFAARVTGNGDGVVSVTARDPEAES